MKKLFILILTATIFSVNVIAQDLKEDPIQTKKSYRFTLGGGYAYRLGKMEKTGDVEVDDFTKKLRHGVNLEASGQLFLTKNIGVGINAIYSRQHESEPERIIPSTSGFYPVKFTETTQFFYLGPSFVVRSKLNKVMCYTEASAGLLIFNDSGEVLNIKADITRPTVGFHLGFSPEYRLSSQLGIGLKLSMTAGFIRTSFYGMEAKTWNVSNASIGAFVSFRTK